MSEPAAPLEAGQPALIRVMGLCHTYLRGTPLETPALHGIDLLVAPGEVIGIVGPTGSGKSTLLQHLNGLLRPQGGEVFVNGVRLSDPQADVRSVRQQVGLLFQSPEDQLFERFAGDDVAFGPRNLGLSADAVRERVRQAMEMVGLPFEYKDRLSTELSQGERRRLALAGVLALQPRVLVLDEPTAGLDPQGRQDLLRFLSVWCQSPGKAIVLATHNMEDIAELCTRVYVLREGRVILHGPSREVFGQCELLRQMGLAIPVAAEAMCRLRQRGY
ncbi:MAG: energy-coupling factor transporter ATPase, partial [Chloroflexi bacterium]|nr:energy-coupling factor transporter ATPase [Chloroflexota bacterium]